MRDLLIQHDELFAEQVVVDQLLLEYRVRAGVSKGQRTWLSRLTTDRVELLALNVFPRFHRPSVVPRGLAGRVHN